MGLTGGLGAGKSEALSALGELGAATLSTDAVVHELLASDELRDIVVARLGDGVARDGALDRSLIAERVFGDEGARRGSRASSGRASGSAWWSGGRRSTRSTSRRASAVVEVPLLFESGMEQAFDATIAVIADEDVRAERAGGRGHASLEERTGRQLSQEEKAQRADYTVRNDATLDELREELSRVVARLDPPSP